MATANNEQRVAMMSFATLYTLYLNKIERKGRTQSELTQVLNWLTGYTPEQLQHLKQDEALSLYDFLNEAPQLNPLMWEMRGSICGYKLQEISSPFMRQVRCMDKLVDDLAKGKSLEKLLPQ